MLLRDITSFLRASIKLSVFLKVKTIIPEVINPTAALCISLVNFCKDDRNSPELIDKIPHKDSNTGLTAHILKSPTDHPRTKSPSYCQVKSFFKYVRSEGTG